MIRSAKLKKEDRVDMVVEIYDSIDNIRSEDHNTEPVYANTKKTLQTQHTACQFGWTYNGSSFYHISINENTWNTSRSYCRMRGADLVIINSRAEQDFVDKLRNKKQAWIGLTDQASEGVWKWVDDSALTTGYWFKGEPNDFNKNEDCALSGFDESPSNWADSSCETKMLCICEKKML
ncbi:CD209 antigen-like protein A isoform X3 [Pygocentrus nattereri]|uniref:C-type lectin domain-containing protein n=1 Tax=Pygocentrus nattereri TaxID=42514 RepID=A0AAR2KI60_PYGNA|nr:CD209 antigen-like protein A isoform X3 [Pygocentrus nattereri]